MKPISLSMLATAALTVAALCTLLVRGGWLMWVPTLLALAVIGTLSVALRR